MGLFTLDFCHLHYKCNSTWIRANFGLPHIHARLYLNANRKSEQDKGYWQNIGLALNHHCDSLSLDQLTMNYHNSGGTSFGLASIDLILI